MKKLLLIATMLLTYGALNAQIAEVKQEGSYARIYNDQGSYTGNSIGLGSGALVSGYNTKYIVVTEGSYARIYDSKGSYTGNSISLGSGSGNYVKNVSANAILIKEGSYTRYYDFKGSYTGNSTSD